MDLYRLVLLHSTVFLYWTVLHVFTEFYCISLPNCMVFLNWTVLHFFTRLLRFITELCCISLLNCTVLYWALLRFITELYCVSVSSVQQQGSKVQHFTAYESRHQSAWMWKYLCAMVQVMDWQNNITQIHLSLTLVFANKKTNKYRNIC